MHTYKKEKILNALQELQNPQTETIAAVTAASPVQLVKSQIQEQLSHISDVSNELETKLLPILSEPDPMADAAGEEKASSCPLVTDLKNYLRQLETTYRFLDSIVNRVEV